METQVNIPKQINLLPLSKAPTSPVIPAVGTPPLRAPQFIKINVSTYVNLNYVDTFNTYNYTSGSLRIGTNNYPISRHFLERAIFALSTIKSRKRVAITTSPIITLKSMYRQRRSMGCYLTSHKNFPKLNQVDYDNICYLIRSNTLTNVYFNDSYTTSFYETLLFFEKKLAHDYLFLRVRNECMVNLKYVKCIQIDSKTKTGVLIGDSFRLTVSRRMLVKLKDKIQQLSFS